MKWQSAIAQFNLQAALNRVKIEITCPSKMATIRQAVRRFATYAERLQAKQAAAES